ncbi:FHA domain-containing protein, partial [Nocardia speluncae]
PGYDQGYDQQGYAQQGAQGYPQGAAQQAPYGAQGGYAPAAGPGFSATLALDDGSGRTYQLREGSNIIGRGQDAHFRLPDTGVSRRHIEVRWDGQTAMLSDLGSTNGTLVNGSPVQDWQLADGDVIRAGHSEILIRIV